MDVDLSIAAISESARALKEYRTRKIEERVRAGGGEGGIRRFDQD